MHVDRAPSFDSTPAFEFVFRSEYATLVSFAIHLCRGPAGEDIAQDAFVALLRRGNVEEIKDPAAWLRTVVLRRVLNETRRQGREERALARMTPPVDAGIDDPPGVDAVLARGLAALPERQRAAVLLVYGEDRSITDAAAIIGCRPATVRVHLHRARTRLAGVAEAAGKDADDA